MRVDDDDFVDIVPTLKGGANSPDLVMACPALGKHKVRRVSFSFRKAVLEEIGGPRYEIAYAIKKRAFRIKAVDQGPYESMMIGLGKDRLVLRCPLPVVGFFPNDARVAPEFFIDASLGIIRVELDDLFQVPPPALVQAPMAGIAPVQLPMIARAGVQSLGEAMLPGVIGGLSITAVERGILHCLLSNPHATRAQLLTATHDPATGRDTRSLEAIDEVMASLKKRFRTLGVQIEAVAGIGFRLGFDDKTRLRAMIKGGS